MLLEKKNAVIYGAGGAVGGAVARVFAREGARVFLASRSREPIEAVAKEIEEVGGVAEVALVDALDQLSVEQHLSDVVKKAGSIDISFNAIGIAHEQGEPLVEMALEEFTRPIIGYMQTEFLTSTAAAKHMIRQGSGVILAITAIPARMAIPNSGGFGVAGAAIEGLWRQLAGELGPHGVRVICLRSAGSPDAPGVGEAIRVHAEQRGISPEAFEASLAEITLLKRMPRLAEVAGAAVLMASDYASSMTGAVANVTCGATLD